VTLVCGFLAVCSAGSAQAQLRKVRLGDRIEPFTLARIAGGDFAYEHSRGRVTVLAFLAAHQKRSERALDDLAEIMSDLRKDEHPVELLALISGGEGLEYFRRVRKKLPAPAPPMLIDANDLLWGRLGVVVTPTIIIIDQEGAIAWIRAGHGYDFASETRARLNLALGVVEEPQSDDDGRVRTLTNDSARDRAKRHLRMGQILARKGAVELGIAELRKAQALTPNVAAIRLELARLLCRAGRAEEALTAVGGIKPATRAEHAQVKMLSGWAYRLLGDPGQALTLLRESLALNPNSGRALYELGKVYEQRGDTKSAMEAYRRALAAHYDEPAVMSAQSP
jgi:tetratricopeptide (TPR) repeat protein